MATLLLQCVGPLQAWGTQSRASVRETGREPSKSGIVGLLCAALGVDRADDLMTQRLAALTMAVRADWEGVIMRDYHTAANVLKSGGGIKPTELSTRYYLSDAAFLVGLEGDYSLLERLQRALADPYWMLFLGRKACPPGLPVHLPDGLFNAALDSVIETYVWCGSNPDRHLALTRVRIVRDDVHGEEIRHDYPLSFATRRFLPRRVTTSFIAPPPLRQRATEAV